MGRSYYDILGVSKDAEEDELKKAYKKLAMKWHPDRNLEDKARAEKEFKAVSEAYQVLSDKDKRQVYDAYGEDGLKMGDGNAPPPTGGMHGFPAGAKGFSFSTGGPGGFGEFRNEFDLFHDLFGNNDPFTSRGGSGFFSSASTDNPYLRSTRSSSQRKKDRDQEQEYGLTLEEMYTGTTKKIRLTREILDASGQRMEVSRVHEFSLKPGTKSGTKIRFEGEGHERHGYVPGDVVLVIKEKPHKIYTRSGNNLVLKKKVSLVDALTGFEITVETLDHRRFRVPVREIINPGYSKTISNEGFPIKGDVNNRGDLVIDFDITFPTYLSSDKKQRLKEVFSSD
ncbi:hypothetical protein NDN08_006349 [Rhodosorus marinus]|uniref:J domain-containing protein n=1 Tax=Rhodosorus marinus TaxID=101924 RepID=A0AAV8UKH9_9RHOD|nr:hypothetical protein NDN08_006349 [Rhodosorus marinus]